jgi:hypothetical protein
MGHGEMIQNAITFARKVSAALSRHYLQQQSDGTTTVPQIKDSLLKNLSFVDNLI